MNIRKQPGKGNYWSIDPAAEDMFDNGSFLRCYTLKENDSRAVFLGEGRDLNVRMRRNESFLLILEVIQPQSMLLMASSVNNSSRTIQVLHDFLEISSFLTHITTFFL